MKLIFKNIITGKATRVFESREILAVPERSVFILTAIYSTEKKRTLQLQSTEYYITLHIKQIISQ